MLLPIGIAVSSIACGALLALVPAARDRLLEPIRTFALTASLAVVGAHLLPEAFEAIHGWALVVFCLALALPSGLHVWAERISGTRHEGAKRPAFGIEIAYAGLLLHQVADGISLGTYGGSQVGGHPHPDVLIAIFAHTVPMVAILVLGMYDAYGRRAAFVRAAFLAVATGAGIVALDLVPSGLVARAAPWISAAAAGLLLHVVAHASHRVRRSGRERAFDLAFAALGLAVALAGSAEHLPLEHGVRHREFGSALFDLSLDVAPLLFAGLLLGALLQQLAARAAARASREPGALEDWLLGVATALGRLPRRSFHSALRGLRSDYSRPWVVVGYAMLAPELGLATLLVSARFLGWRFALIRLGALLLLSAVSGYVLARFARAPAPEVDAAPLLRVAPSSLQGVLRSLDETLTDSGAWIALGLFVAAFAESEPLAHVLARITGLPAQILAVGLLAALAARAAPSAAVLAAVLIAKGLLPATVLVGLLLGPPLLLVVFGLSRRSFVERAACLLPLALMTLTCGFAFDQLSPNVTVHAHDVAVGHEHGMPTYIAACALGLLALSGVWRLGASAWLGTLWNGVELGRDVALRPSSEPEA